MKTFKDTNNQLHVIDEAFKHLLPEGCIEITQEEADAIHLENNPPPDPQIQINADARAYLASTDWVVAKMVEYAYLQIQTQEQLSVKYADILEKRQEARNAIV